MRTLLIGDIHGDLDAVKATYTENADALIIQMGDFGFKDTYSGLSHYDSNRLKILGGNHDEYGHDDSGYTAKDHRSCSRADAVIGRELYPLPKRGRTIGIAD